VNAPEAIPCRWKQLRGAGRDAIYRATCGRASCPGHLGDLSYFAPSEEWWEELAALVTRGRPRLELDADDRSPLSAVAAVVRSNYLAEFVAFIAERKGLTAAQRELAIKRLETKGVERELFRAGWHMQAEQHESVVAPHHDPPEAIYYGHRDSGFRISVGGKRSRDGLRIGRRAPTQPTPPGTVETLGPRYVEGQRVRLTDRVWCRVCGTLNQLVWPEPLKDSKAQ